MAEDVVFGGFHDLIGGVDAGREYSGKEVLGRKNLWDCTEDELSTKSIYAIIDCHQMSHFVRLLNASRLHKIHLSKTTSTFDLFVASPPDPQPSHQHSQRLYTPLNSYTHKHHNSPSHTPTPASESPTRTDYRYCTSTTAHSHPASPASTISHPSGTWSSSSPWSSRSRHRSSRRGRLGCWYPRVRR